MDSLPANFAPPASARNSRALEKLATTMDPRIENNISNTIVHFYNKLLILPLDRDFYFFAK
jgi:hypothetical protein